MHLVSLGKILLCINTQKVIILKYVMHYLHSYPFHPWNETVECDFVGCTCDSECEPHTCMVIYRQVYTKSQSQLQCVCGIVLGNSTSLNCRVPFFFFFLLGKLYKVSVAVCLWFRTGELYKSHLQCACDIVLGNSTDK